MYDCEYYQELMSRLLDEGVTAEEERQLKEHVRSCPECAKLFSAFSAMTVSLREDLEEPPAELAQGVMARIAAEKEGRRVIHVQRPEIEQERPRRRQPRRRKNRWAGIAAAACLAVVIGGGAFWALRGRDKSASIENAAPEAAYARAAGQEAPMAVIPEAAVEGEVNAIDEPMAIAEDSALALADSADAAAVPTGAPVPEPLPVRDVARRQIGSIAVEDIPAFAAFLEGGTVLGGAQGDWEFLFSVVYDDREISFATDEKESRLIWWDPNTPVTVSPGSLDALRDMVSMDEPPVPK